MTFNTEIRGLSFFYDDDGKRPYVRLAIANVFLPDFSMEISGVVLTWSKSRGYVAMPPNALVKGGRHAVHWYNHSPFTRDLAAKLSAAYLAMGGEPPEAANDNEPADDKPYDITLPRFIIKGLPA